MQEFAITSEPQKHSVFDNYVPIVKEGRHTDIYLTDTIEAPAEYTETCRVIERAYKEDTITLHINSGGGWVDSGFMLVDVIGRSNAVVTAQLSGTVASIATIIALSCDKLVVAEHISWLSHNYSAGIQGKGGEMKAQMEFMSSELAISFKQLHKGFFTSVEMDGIIEDKDMWLNRTEILGRWEAMRTGNSQLLEFIASVKKSKQPLDLSSKAAQKLTEAADE